MVQRRPTGHHRELLVKRLGRFRQAVGLCLLGGHPSLQLSDGSRLESRGPALGEAEPLPSGRPVFYVC